MNAILTIALKDLLELWRDRVGIFWVIGFPLVIAIFIGLVYSGMGSPKTRSLHVGIVNEDGSEFSQTFIDTLKKKEALALEIHDLSTAENLVRRGKLIAYLHLHKGFGEDMGIFGKENKTLEIGMDPSRKAEAAFLQGMIVQSLYESMNSQLSDKTRSKEMLQKGRNSLSKDTTMKMDQKEVLGKFYNDLDQFISKSDPSIYQSGFMGGNKKDMGISTKSVGRDYTGQPRSSFDITFPSSIIWGLVACATTFAVSIVMERRKGTYQRLRISPIASSQILLGKGMACFMACFGDIVVLLIIGIVGFHVKVGNLYYLILAAFCTSWCFVGAMMFISVMGKTEAAVGGTGWAVFILMMMLGGGMVPLIFMPNWMAVASSFSPVKWCIVSMEGAIWRDFTFYEMLLPCGILIGVGTFLFFIGWWILQKIDYS